MNAGTIAIIVMLGCLPVVIAWYLVYVAHVPWFKERLLHGNRTQRVIGMLPIAVPVYVFAMMVVRPFFS